MTPNQPADQRGTLEEILSQLSAPRPYLEEFSWYVQLCVAALKFVDRGRQPELWAELQRIKGDNQQQDATAPPAERLEEAIESYELALTVYTRKRTPMEWAAVVVNLAKAYGDRFRGDRAENQERAIQLYEQALSQLTSKKTPVEWAIALTNLASAYWGRIRGQRAENVEHAIELNKQVLRVRTKDSAPLDWAKTMVHLGNAYRDRVYGGLAENQENAIHCLEQALTVWTQQSTPAEWAMASMNLGTAYWGRTVGNPANNVELAIECLERALSVWTREKTPAEWAMTMVNRAVAFRDRVKGDRAQNIELAIQGCQQALMVWTRETPVEWVKTTLCLANIYRVRIRGERMKNRELAIHLYEQILTVATPEKMPIESAITMENLGITLNDRTRGERADNQERAIDLYQQAVNVYAHEAMRVEWARAIVNLAIAYSDRILSEKESNQEYAIALFRQALTVYTRKDLPLEWARAKMNLGNAYSSRVAGRRAENLEQAISFYREALTVFSQETIPLEWARTKMNLGNVYYNRIQGQKAENLEAAILSFQETLTIYTLEGMPTEFRYIQSRIGDLFLRKGDWKRAGSAYKQALEANELLYEAAATTEARTAELSTLQHVPAGLAYALMAQSNRNPEEAVTVLERGRARLMAEALEFDRIVPEQVAPADRSLLELLRDRIREMEGEGRRGDYRGGDYVVHSEQLTKVRLELRQLIERIRSYVPEFLPHPEFKDVADVVEQTQMIYLAATAAGGIAFSVSTKGFTAVTTRLFLPKLLNEELRRKLNRYVRSFHAWHNSPGKPQLQQQALSELDDLLGWIWDAAMGEIVRLLSPQEPTVLVPLGLLCFVPLHAAWTADDKPGSNGRRYALDAGQISYAPSAKVLAWARRRADIDARSILAIDEPQSTSAAPLLNSFYEVESAISYFLPERRKSLRRRAATHSEVIKNCPEYAVLHFSCHGYANLQKPLESALLMANDDLLTVNDFLELHLSKTRLAVLSACETGLPGMEVPDEMIGLPAGLLQAGVAGVVGTMWSVNDASTMMIMVRFYELWKAEGLEPVSALRTAQLWVRDTTNREKAEYFRSVARSRANRSIAASGAVEYLHQNMALENPDARAFAHPYHWGGFSYFGA